MHDRERVLILYGRRQGGGAARVDLRMIAFFAVVLLLLVLAGWLYLRQASEVAALASEIRELELDKESRHRELVTLRGQVAMLGSLKRVLNEGLTMGYTMPDAAGDQALVIECSDNCVPPEEVGVVVPASEAAAVTGNQAGWWDGVVGRLNAWLRAVLPAW